MQVSVPMRTDSYFPILNKGNILYFEGKYFISKKDNSSSCPSLQATRDDWEGGFTSFNEANVYLIKNIGDF